MQHQIVEHRYSATLIVQYLNSATFNSATVNIGASNSATSNRATLK